MFSFEDVSGTVLLRMVWKNMRVFLLWADVEERDLVLQEEEVLGVRWMDLEECVNAIAAGTIEHCISLEELKLVQAAAKK